MVRVPRGTVIWAGKRDYGYSYIRYAAREPKGCLCPPEAFPFARAAGIEIVSWNVSPFKAVGCHIEDCREEDLPKIDSLVLRKIQNQDLLYLLQVY